MGRRWLATAIIAVVSSVCAPAAPGATVGDRDPTFNGGNPLQIDSSASATAQVFDTAVVDHDNRTTLGGSITGAAQLALLARLTPGGAFDTTFGTGGIKTTAGYDGDPSMTAEAFGLDSQFRLTGAFVTGAHQLGARLVDNGGLQAIGYGTTGGFTATPGHNEGDNYAASAVGPDGSVYFVDDASILHPATDLRIDKIDASGNQVPGYGGLFAVTSDVSPGGGPIVAAVDSQNRLVVARTAVIGGRREASIMRFTAAGAKDTSWGTGSTGEVDIAGTGSGIVVSSIAIAPGDQVAIAGSILGSSSDANFVDELSAAGVQSPTFAFVSQTSFPGLLAVQPDGKIVEAQAFITPFVNTWGVLIRRFTTAGALDSTFAGGAKLDGSLNSSVQFPDTAQQTAVAISPDGRKLIFVGQWHHNSSGRTTPFVYRFLLQDPTLAPELTTAPHVTGSPTPGGALTCGAGTWTNSPTIQVFWDRAPRTVTSNEDPAWSQLPAIGTQYVIQPADVGSRIRCRERATNANGSADGPSNSLRADAGVPALVAQPTISGQPITFQSMHCDPGQWTNFPDLSVQWLDDGTPIPNATARDYTLQGSDRHAHIACQVTASNDVGAALAPARSSNDALVVADVPREIIAPTISQASIGPKPTDIRLSCGHGVWDDDYGTYDYEWERAGAIIAGAVGQTYDATVADLGQELNCEAFSTNPVGRSRAAGSGTTLVALPTTGQPGAIYTAGGFNHLDPVNMMAVTQGWLDAVKGLVVARRQAAADAARTTCKTSNPNAALPNFSAELRTYMSAANTCGVLLRAPASQIVYPPGGGIYWTGDGGSCYQATGSGTTCPILRITVPVLNAATPPDSLSSLETATLEAVKPVEVLWDFNDDGKTDAMCDPDAPIVRTLPSPASTTSAPWSCPPTAGRPACSR